MVQYRRLYTSAVRYSLLLLGHKPIHRVTVLNAVGNRNTLVSIILYYKIIILWDYRRICGPSLTEMSLCGAYLYIFSSEISKTIIIIILFLIHISQINGISVGRIYPVEVRDILWQT
jgi:hypothetical protein